MTNQWARDNKRKRYDQSYGIEACIKYAEPLDLDPPIWVFVIVSHVT